ncbi:hypothetical protein CLV70_102460 [Pseudosporangium ferrugineum]|uniref:SMI1/KNR4 family protein SUKH-1 n=1 Tax=Pseudosporangium ferrugineum TaxID=439699 RepID=A0A2T0SFR4_9ACTN|nr:hypothetical protein [Pseudosporangium ferrugineum]PRY32249.1 hypothetical protein CLV70_102460 [Pseudosporangium ferrugineum]
MEEAHGLRLPPDLAAWWRRSDGVTPGAGSTASIIPGGFYPATTSGAVANLLRGRELAVREAGVDQEYADLVAEIRAHPAGSTTDAWARLDEWVTVSEDSDALFVDCRAGRLHGCVMLRSGVGGQIGPLWPDITAMWTELADLLERIDPAAPPESVTTSVSTWHIPSSWGEPPR